MRLYAGGCHSSSMIQCAAGSGRGPRMSPGNRTPAVVFDQSEQPRGAWEPIGFQYWGAGHQPVFVATEGRPAGPAFHAIDRVAPCMGRVWPLSMALSKGPGLIRHVRLRAGGWLSAPVLDQSIRSSCLCIHCLASKSAVSAREKIVVGESGTKKWRFPTLGNAILWC